MIKNISDQTIRLEFGNIYLTELPSGWNYVFEPEMEDFLCIKYSGKIVKVNEKGEIIQENQLIQKVLEMTSSKETEIKPEEPVEEVKPEEPAEEPVKKRGRPKKRGK